MTTQTDIEIVQRQTFTMTLTWTTNATPPQPIDLSGYRAHMQLRRKPGVSGTPLIDVSSVGTNPGITLQPGGSLGVVAVRIPASETALLTKDCWYDIFVIKSDDATEATRLASGKVTVSLSVTSEA